MTLKQRTFILALVVIGIIALVLGGALHNAFSIVAYLAGAMILVTALIGMFVSLAAAIRRTRARR